MALRNLLASMGRTRDGEYLVAFGNQIRKLRTIREWSQYDLSAACGIDRSQLARIERGETNATLSTAKMISNALGVTMSELVNF
jgi:transcriptional regulator with XRE-family HTH domain